MKNIYIVFPLLVIAVFIILFSAQTLRKSNPELKKYGQLGIIAGTITLLLIFIIGYFLEQK